MTIKIIITYLLLFTSITFPQTALIEDTSVVESNKTLRSYITFGYGRTINYTNWAVGGGLFFALGKNIMIGPRSNANFELDTFSKSPGEMNCTPKTRQKDKQLSDYY